MSYRPVLTARDPRLLPDDVKESIKNKDIRWADKRLIDEHKALNGYSIVKEKDGAHDREVQREGMILMARSKEFAHEREKQRAQRHRDQTSQTKNQFRNEVENLSRKHGMNLHKLADEQDVD